MSNVTIDTMTKQECPMVYQIACDVFSDPWSLQTYERLLTQQECECICAYVEGVLVGYSCIQMLYETAELLQIAVSDSYRRRGIGKLLLMEALELAKRAGAREMLLEVREGNNQARALYDVMGFEILTIRKQYYTSPTENAVIMRKEL